MQQMADITGMDIRIHSLDRRVRWARLCLQPQPAGIHKNVESAMNAMGTGFEKTYYPDQHEKILYQKRYQKYINIGSQYRKYSHSKSMTRYQQIREEACEANKQLPATGPCDV